MPMDAKNYQASCVCGRAAAWDKPRSGKNALVAGAFGVTVSAAMITLLAKAKI
jgi:hypothetical protein